MENNEVSISGVENNNKKDLRGILIHLETELADKFYSLAKSGQFFNKKSPTALLREIALQFVEQHSVENK